MLFFCCCCCFFVSFFFFLFSFLVSLDSRGFRRSFIACLCNILYQSYIWYCVPIYLPIQYKFMHEFSTLSYIVLWTSNQWLKNSILMIFTVFYAPGQLSSVSKIIVCFQFTELFLPSPYTTLKSLLEFWIHKIHSYQHPTKIYPV